MLQFGGKDLERHFTVVIGSKEHGLYISSTPSSAAKKAVTKLCASNKEKKVDFYMRETTQSSEKKVYGPYSGYLEKLKEPIELKGRVIKYKPVAKLMKKSGGAGNLKNRFPYTALINNQTPPALTPHLSRNKINKSILSDKNRLYKFITKHFPITIEYLDNLLLYESNGFQFDLNFVKFYNNSSVLTKENFNRLLRMYIYRILEFQSKTNIFFSNHPELSENEKKFVQDYINSFNKFEIGFYEKTNENNTWTKINKKKPVIDNKNYQIDEARRKELEKLAYNEIITKIDLVRCVF